MAKKIVYLVGAGPGDAGLITIRGLQRLQQADCVIYDGLANPALLDACRPHAEKICVAKRCGAHRLRQDEINALLVEKARQYDCVVRLKGGDPGLFGRAAEEASACRAAGFEVQIIPGVTAASAAAAYSGIFLTDRAKASAVALITGRQADDTAEPLDWRALASFCGTLVFYMAMDNLGDICQQLMAAGKAADTPASVVYQATLPQQKVLTGRLDTIAAACRAEGIGAPAVVIIGSAATPQQPSWFMAQPLFGKTVIICRDASSNRLFADKLAARGAVVLPFDGLVIEPLTAPPQTQTLLEAMAQTDWVVFTSANGVSAVFAALYAAGKDARAFAGVRLACIGSQTAARLAEFGLQADFVPTDYTANALAIQLAAGGNVAGKRFLLLRSEIAPPDLKKHLSESGGLVREIPVYTVRPIRPAENQIQAIHAALENRQAAWITFTSSSAVQSFLSVFPPAQIVASGAHIASIGPVCSHTLTQAGLSVAVEASVHTTDGIIDAVETYCSMSNLGHD